MKGYELSSEGAIQSLRTDDVSYGQDYWDTLDSGAGYQDSPYWEDLAFMVKETLYYDHNGKDLSSTHNFLDVGCASGYLVRHLRRRGIEAWGVDISQYALNQAPKDVADYLRPFDLTKEHGGTIAGYPFDRISCFETLEHIPEEAVDVALFTLFEALKPQGVALLTICLDDCPGWDSDPTHVTIKPRQWWTERLLKVGFSHDDRYQNFRRYQAYKAHSGVFVLRKDTR